MKSKIVLFILAGLALNFLDSPTVSAKNDTPHHSFQTVATASPTRDIDTPEIDSKENDLGRGEHLSESTPMPEDIDSNENDLGQGEPFTRSDALPDGRVSIGEGGGDQAGIEILVGEDFTDAIKEKNFSDESLLKSLTLQKDSVQK